MAKGVYKPPKARKLPYKKRHLHAKNICSRKKFMALGYLLMLLMERLNLSRISFASSWVRPDEISYSILGPKSSRGCSVILVIPNSDGFSKAGVPACRPNVEGDIRSIARSFLLRNSMVCLNSSL